MTTYHLRISSQEQKYVDFILANTVKPITVFENADEEVNRDHLHSIFYLNVKSQTFRNNLLKKFPEIKGNSFYTLRENDDTDKNYRYVCKGKSQGIMPIVQHNMAEIDIQEKHNAYWLVNTVIKKDIKKDSTKTIVREITEQFKKEYPTISSLRYDQLDPIVLKYEVLRYVMIKLRNNAKGYDKFIVERLVNGVYNQLVPKTAFNDMVKLIFTPEQRDDLERQWTYSP